MTRRIVLLAALLVALIIVGIIACDDRLSRQLDGVTKTYEESLGR